VANWPCPPQSLDAKRFQSRLGDYEGDLGLARRRRRLLFPWLDRHRLLLSPP
jgi:hypothetical protein